MASPTLSMAALASQVSSKSSSKSAEKGSVRQRAKASPESSKVAVTPRQSNGKCDQAKPAQQTANDSRGRRHVTEEVNEDSIYCICLKKITYTFNNSLNKQANSSNFVTRCDQVDSCRGTEKSNTKWYDDQQVRGRLHRAIGDALVALFHYFDSWSAL